MCTDTQCVGNIHVGRHVFPALWLDSLCRWLLPGTFSHRHACVIEQSSDQPYVFLNHIADKQEKISVVNSLLSEYGVLGFEMG